MCGCGDSLIYHYGIRDNINGSFEMRNLGPLCEKIAETMDIEVPEPNYRTRDKDAVTCKLCLAIIENSKQMIIEFFEELQ